MDNSRFFTEIKEEVIKKLAERNDNYSVDIREVVKANDTLLHSIVINRDGCRIAPAIYLENYIRCKGEGMGREEIADIIIAAFDSLCKTAPDINNVSFDYEYIRQRAVMQLADEEKNRERIKSLAHCQMGAGYVAIIYVLLDTTGEGFVRFAVTEDMMNGMGYDREELLLAAAENTVKRFEPVLADIDKVANMENYEDDENNLLKEGKIQNGDMLVLTNRENYMGAISLFYPGIKERIGEIIDDDYYVLPSSIHELIIVPAEKALDKGRLEAIVFNANREILDRQEVLSDRIIFYSRDEKRLSETDSL